MCRRSWPSPALASSTSGRRTERAWPTTRACSARGDTDVALVLKVHPSNYRIEGFTEGVEVAELATLDVPVVVDIGSGLLDAACPWLKGGPPEWVKASARHVRRSRRARQRSRSRATSSSAVRRRASSPVAANVVDACARHPLARALRAGGLTLAALQATALAYLSRDGDAIPFWRMATVPVGELRARAEAIDVGKVVETQAVAGRARFPAPRSRRPASRSQAITRRRCAPRSRSRSSPACTTTPRSATCAPSIRCTMPRSHLHSERWLDRRHTANPRHRDCRPRRPRQVHARPRADRHRPRPIRGGEAARAHDRPRLRMDRAAFRRATSRSWTCPATSASSRTCLRESVRSTRASSSSRRRKAGSRRARSICASSSCSASRTG